jgi:hypothetical protein
MVVHSIAYPDCKTSIPLIFSVGDMKFLMYKEEVETCGNLNELMQATHVMYRQVRMCSEAEGDHFERLL